MDKDKVKIASGSGGHATACGSSPGLGCSPSYFLLDGVMHHFSAIEFVEVDGGPTGFGCWGRIKLFGWDEEKPMGDGSYYRDGRHQDHVLAGSPEAPDYNFTQLRAIMRAQAMAEYHIKPKAAENNSSPTTDV